MNDAHHDQGMLTNFSNLLSVNGNEGRSKGEAKKELIKRMFRDTDMMKKASLNIWNLKIFHEFLVLCNYSKHKCNVSCRVREIHTRKKHWKPLFWLNRFTTSLGKCSTFAVNERQQVWMF